MCGAFRRCVQSTALIFARIQVEYTNCNSDKRNSAMCDKMFINAQIALYFIIWISRKWNYICIHCFDFIWKAFNSIDHKWLCQCALSVRYLVAVCVWTQFFCPFSSLLFKSGFSARLFIFISVFFLVMCWRYGIEMDNAHHHWLYLLTL